MNRRGFIGGVVGLASTCFLGKGEKHGQENNFPESYVQAHALWAEELRKRGMNPLGIIYGEFDLNGDIAIMRRGNVSENQRWTKGGYVGLLFSVKEEISGESKIFVFDKYDSVSGVYSFVPEMSKEWMERNRQCRVLRSLREKESV